MIRFFALIALGLSMVGTAKAEANRPVLVELFANQNCPACPKAHRTMKQIQAERDDIFILTWTVNYWDYLGAPDPMAIPEAMARQSAYAERFELRGPYTPQSVYDGVEQCPGNKLRRVNKAIDRRAADISPHIVIARTDNGGVSVSGAEPRDVDLSLIHFADIPDSDMVNPVLSVEALGPWTGDTMTFAPKCAGRCAVIAQASGYGPIEAAILLD